MEITDIPALHTGQILINHIPLPPNQLWVSLGAFANGKYHALRHGLSSLSVLLILPNYTRARKPDHLSERLPITISFVIKAQNLSKLSGHTL